MNRPQPPEVAAIDALVDRYRARCLWFLRPDYHPATDEERRRALEYIERYGDLEAYRETGRLKRWLSRSCNATSAV